MFLDYVDKFLGVSSEQESGKIFFDFNFWDFYCGSYLRALIYRPQMEMGLNNKFGENYLKSLKTSEFLKKEIFPLGFSRRVDSDLSKVGFYDGLDVSYMRDEFKGYLKKDI